jgi:hypothetical protein
LLNWLIVRKSMKLLKSTRTQRNLFACSQEKKPGFPGFFIWVRTL